MADRFSVSCPKCGLGVDLEMGVFGWKAVKCPKCREKITFEKSRMKIVHCRGCDNDVVYDLARQNPCPICKRELVENESDEEHVSVVCPDCDIVVELEKGLFGWKKTNCPKCGKKMRMKDQETQLVECPNCKRNVVYNIMRRNNCPSCNGPLYDPATMAQRMTIACPFCQVDVEYTAGDTYVECPVCQQGFNPTKTARVEGVINTASAMDIRMTGDLAPDQLIWKHPLQKFPLSARIIACPGMTAVVVQGDQQAFAVNGQSVMLSETSLQSDAYEYGDNQQEKYVYVDVYYVRNSIRNAHFAWGGKASLLGGYNDVHAFALNGTCELAPIVDHAAFLRWVQFDTGVKTGDFAIARDARGVETVGGYAKAISMAMRSIYGEALRRVRDRRNILPSMLSDCGEELVYDVQQLANAELSRWGVEIQQVVLDDMKYLGIDVHGDPLRLRVEGGLDWATMEIPVHLKDKPLASAKLRMHGSLYITVSDEARLKSSAAAVRWSNGGENAAREEIGRHVGDLLGSMFTSIFQNLIEDMNPPLDMLSTYAGYLKAQAEQLLNGPAELLAQHGLLAQQLTLNVKIAEKSSLYALEEQTNLTISESDVKEKLYEYEEDRKLGRRRNDIRRELDNSKLETDAMVTMLGDKQKIASAQADAEIAEMHNRARVAQVADKLRHDQAMTGMNYAAEEDELRRRTSFAAWQEQNRAEAAREQAAMESIRRRTEFEHAAQRDQAAHDRAIHDIMRAVEESDQTWREKLDAYARLQRNLAAQDELDHKRAERRADTDDRIYDGFQKLHLSEDTTKAALAMEKEAALLKEEKEKACFARDLELRRQTLAEEMERLTAQHQQVNKRLELEHENETLRLMLEYLARQGEQQVAQTSMQTLLAQAKADAERVSREQKEASAQLRADALHREQVAREDLMAARAHELTKEMMATQRRLAEMEKENEHAYNSGRAMVDAKGRQYQDEQITALVKEVEKLSDSMKDAKKNNASTGLGSELSKWFEMMMKEAMATPTKPVTTPASTPVVTPVTTPATPYTPPVGGGLTRRCPYCQAEMNFNAFVCPNGHRC